MSNVPRPLTPIAPEAERAFYGAFLAPHGDEDCAATLDTLAMRHAESALGLHERLHHLRSEQYLAAGGAEVLRRLRAIGLPGRLDGRYEFVGRLGEGGFGTVTVAMDRLLDRRVALKTIRSRWGESLAELDPELVKRFLDEVDIAAGLNHPGVPILHDVGVNALGVPFFTMRLVRGRTLRDIIEAHLQQSPSWPRERVLRLLAGVAEAVEYAHGRGVLHRDLKPANVVVGRYGEVTVLDWGLARVDDPEFIPSNARNSGPQEHSTGKGSLGYTAPEQWEGKATERSDIFSLGAVLHHILCGAPPPNAWPGEEHYILPEDAHRSAPDLTEICRRAIARDPSSRFALMSDLRAALWSACYAAESGAVESSASIWRRLIRRLRAALTSHDGTPSTPGPEAVDHGTRSDDLPIDIALDPTFDDLVMPWDDPESNEETERARIEALGAASGRYVTRRELGRGGMARVLRAADQVLNRSVVLKVCIDPADGVQGSMEEPMHAAASTLYSRSDHELFHREGLRRSRRLLLHESRLQARLDHPAILGPHDLTLDAAGRVAIVYPLVQGGDLRQLAQSLGPGSWRVTTHHLLGAGRALASAHDVGIVHRDVKPANILLGGHHEAYLMDWSVATHVAERGAHGQGATPPGGIELGACTRVFFADADGVIVGTPGYMAPEQARGEPAMRAADVFSLGATLFELLTGRTRVNADGKSGRSLHEVIDMAARGEGFVAVRTLRRDIPRSLAAVCDRALRPEPGDRYRDAGEFILALEQALLGTR